MVASLIFPLTVLTSAYLGAIGAFIWLLRRAGMPARWAILLGFSGFGLGTGLLSAWIWPLDSSVYPNVWSVLLGDWLYNISSSHLADLWLLRVPQVYALSGVLLYGGLGLMVQELYRRRQARRAVAGNRMSRSAF
jgi:hypothetical protein